MSNVERTHTAADQRSEKSMKRKSSVIRYIGKFNISVDEIENLSEEIETSTAGGRLTLYDIELETEFSTYTFENVEELRQNRTWGKIIKTFSITFKEISGDGGLKEKDIKIKGGDLTDNYIYASGDDEAWVIGTANILSGKMKRYQVWYSRLVKGFFSGLMCYCIVALALILSAAYLVSKFINDSTTAQILYVLSFFISIAVSLWLMDNIFTRSTLLESKSNGARKYGLVKVVLTIIIAITGIVSLVLQI